MREARAITHLLYEFTHLQGINVWVYVNPYCTLCKLLYNMCRIKLCRMLAAPCTASSTACSALNI